MLSNLVLQSDNILQVREVFLARVQFRVRSDAEAQGRVQRVGRVRQAERRRGGRNNQNSHLYLSLKFDCGKSMSVDITRSAPACPQMPPLQEQGRLRVGEAHGARGERQFELLHK